MPLPSLPAAGVIVTRFTRRLVGQVDMDVESLNQKECFVLDMGDKIYLYSA